MSLCFVKKVFFFFFFNVRVQNKKVYHLSLTVCLGQCFLIDTNTIYLPRNFKGGIGFLFDPRVLILWGGGHIDRHVWR